MAYGEQKIKLPPGASLIEEDSEVKLPKGATLISDESVKKKEPSVAGSSESSVGESNGTTSTTKQESVFGNQYPTVPKKETVTEQVPEYSTGLSSRKKRVKSVRDILVLNQTSAQPKTDESHIQKPITDVDVEHELKRTETRKKNMELAIDNTTEKALKLKGINAAKGTPLYEEQRNLILKKTKPTMVGDVVVSPADVVYATDKDGKPGLSNTINWWEDLTKGWDEAINGEDEARAFDAMSTEEKVAHANQVEAEKTPTEYVSEHSGVIGGGAHTLAAAAPFLAKAGAGAAIGAMTGGTGAPLIMAMAATAPDMINQGMQRETLDRYYQLKKENPNVDDVTLMKKAEQGKISGGIQGAAENLLFIGTGLKAPLSAEVKQVLGKNIVKSLESSAHVGVVTGAVKGAGLAERAAEGYHVDAEDAINQSVGTMLENFDGMLSLNIIIHGVTGLANVPKTVLSAAKYSLKNTRIEEIRDVLALNEQAGKIPEGTTEKVTQDIQGYNNALSKTAEGLTPEAQSAVAGLIQKRDNIVSEMATKDITQQPLYAEKINAINEQIKKITETNDPIKYEVDEVTGQPLSEKPTVVEPVNKPETPKGEETAAGEMVNEVDPIEQHLDKGALSGVTKPEDAYKLISEQAQGISKGEKLNGDAFTQMEEAYGKKIVDAAIEKYPAEKLLKEQPSSTVSSEVESAEGKTYVHETSAENFDKFDLNKIGSGQGDAWLGKGIYLQEIGTLKLESYGKNKIEAVLKPEAKIFDVKETPNGEYRDSFVEWAVKNTEIGKRKLKQRIDEGLSLKNLLPRDILKNSPEAVERLKEQGYDGLNQDGELVVYNPEVLEVKKSKNNNELENKKRDIEKRRQDEKDNFDPMSKPDLASAIGKLGTAESWFAIQPASINKQHLEAAKKIVDDISAKYEEEINSKYDAELAALEKSENKPIQNEAANEVQQPAEAKEPTATEPPKIGEEAEGGEKTETKELDKLATTIPNGGEVKKYLSGDTIKKYEEGTELRNNQEITAQELEPALKHGVDTIEKAKEIFGDKYVEKTLDYIEREKLNPENKALLYVSLENDIAKRILEEPDNAGLKKLQDLIRTKSQAYLRSNSLAINMGRLRKFAEVGYDISKVTDKFFSSKELEEKAAVEKLVQADADTINKEAELKESESGFTAEVEQKIKEGVEKEINSIYEKLPTNRKKAADKAIKALDDIQKKLRGKTYDATLGIPVAIIDAGITTIKNAIKVGVSIADAVELGISKIKEKYGKAWDKEKDFREDMLKGFKDISDAKLDPAKYVKDTLIEQGYGREVTIKTKDGKEKRKILDWKKLAGEEGSPEKISENISNALKKDVADKKFTEAEVLELKDDFIKEYNDLRASVVEKGLNEMASRNKTTVTPLQKSAAKKLAEMYNYGLFDKDPVEYETTLAKTIGIDRLNDGRAQKVRELGEAMASLYSSSYQGKRLSESQMRTAIQVVEEKMRELLHAEANKHGSTPLMLADMVRTYMDAAQRMTLNNLKQALENPLSGLWESLYSTIGYSKSSSGKLSSQQLKSAAKLYKEMVVQKGVGYGNVSTTFVNKGNLEVHINKMSNNKLFHGIASTLLGRTTLDAVDSFYKAKITQQKFASLLTQVLTKDRLIKGKVEKGMTKGEAKKYVTEKLTGESFKEAQATAKKIIDKANAGKEKKIFNDSPEFVDRLANDIVTASLVNGEKITEEMVTAAYNAAYKAAGRGLGHVANNFISQAIGTTTGKIESRINDAIKEKEYNKAAALTMQSILYRNIANPFVGGGTNWVVLKAEKTGLGLLSGLGSMMEGGRKMDLTSEVGIKKLEQAMYQNLKVKDKFIRGTVGAMVTALSALAFAGISSTDEYRKWRSKNMWAARYLDTLTPEVILGAMAAKDDKLKRYVESSLNQNDQFDKTKKIIEGSIAAVKGDTETAKGKLGEVAGGIVGAPFPWRLVRDGQQILQGVSGDEVYKVDNRPSQSVLEGYFKGGLFDYLGFAPEQQDPLADQKKNPVFKKYLDKEIKLPLYEPDKIQTKEVNGKVVEHLSDYDEPVQKEYKLKAEKYLTEYLKDLEAGKIKIYVDKNGTASTPTTAKGKEGKTKKQFKDLTKEQLNNVIHGSGGIIGDVTEKVKEEVLKGKKPKIVNN